MDRETKSPAQASRPDRWRFLLDAIDARLDSGFDVVDLVQLAGLSVAHGQRQFSRRFGLPMARYASQLRLLRAGRQLAFRPGLSITDIALDAGFEHSESFSRAFRRVAGQSPSAFRAAPNWAAWAPLDQAIQHVRRQSMQPLYQPDQVRLVQFPATHIALLMHVGPERGIGASVRRFIDWRRARGLSPSRSATFNLLYDDPTVVPEHTFRLGIAAATPEPISDPDAGITAAIIPAGPCAVLRHVGAEAGLEAAIRFLLEHWLPASGRTLRDFPIVLQRIKFFPDVAAHQETTDLFLPLMA